MRHQIAMRAVDVNAGEAGLFDDTCRCRELSDRVLDLVIGHRSSVIARAEIRHRGRYVRSVPWGPDSVIGILWSPPRAPFPGTCSGCLFRSRTGPSRTT